MATHKSIYYHTSTLILTILIISTRNETKRKITFNDFALEHTKNSTTFIIILTGKNSTTLKCLNTDNA